MRFAICAACVTFGLPASAQVSPDALWKLWRSGEEAVVAIEGTPRSEAGGLVIDGAVLRLGPEVSAPRIHADKLRMVAEDGATLVSLPSRWRVEGEDGTTAAVSAKDFDIRVGGTIEAPDYRVREDQLAASAVITFPDGIVEASLEATMLELTASTADGESRLRADALSVTATPRDAEQGRISASYEDLSAALAGSPRSGPADGADALSLTTDAAASRQSFTAPLEEGGAPATLDITSGPSRSEVSVDAGRMEARQTASGLTFSAAGEQVPLPDARIDVDALTMALTTPAEPVAESVPVSVDLGLTGVTPSEQIWQLLDPGADLPREPAELRLSLSGRMFWQTDQDPPVPALERVSLDTMRISALGAEISGDGGVQFTPPATPGRPGKPVGALAFSLTGFNALLDKLAALGTLPQGQIVGLRMGLGILAMPGEGEDTLRTEVEFAPDGVVVVNGAPVARMP